MPFGNRDGQIHKDSRFKLITVLLYLNESWAADGGLHFEATPAGPGDQVTLTAAIDVLVVLSACPMDINPINGGVVSAIGYELLPA